MIEKMMERVAILADLPVPKTAPTVREVPWQDIWKHRPGIWALYLKAPTGGRDFAEIIHAPGYAHLVVHELCHHAQQLAGKNPASRECENEAYRVQSIYFRLFPDDFQKEWMP